MCLYTNSYAVQFIADDLGVAFVVVSAGHGELQRPEQTVEHLNTPEPVFIHHSVNTNELHSTANTYY